MIPQTKVMLTGLAILALGGLSGAAWLAEVALLKGWEGLRWLDGYPNAVFVGVPCVVLSVALPILISRSTERKQFALFVASACLIAWLSFDLARNALLELHSPSAAWMVLAGKPAMARTFIARELGALVSAGVLAAVGFTVAVRIFLAHVGWWTAGLFLLAIALVMPMGMLTIRVVPALNGQTDYLHVVKMGYPLFWTNVLMGLASWLAVRAAAPTPEDGAQC
jgi:hypothetical protein